MPPSGTSFVTPRPLSLLLACLFLSTAVLPNLALGCTPPPVGQPLQTYQPEREVDEFLKASDAVFVGSLLSEVEISDPQGFANREARFSVGKVHVGHAHRVLRFLDSTCGSPLQLVRPIKPGESLLLLAKQGTLLKAYRDTSPHAVILRRRLLERASLLKRSAADHD